MKTILFCNLPYAFSILKPLADELDRLGYEYIWFVPKDFVGQFLYKNMKYTSIIEDLKIFKSDAIFAPGNDVPYWIRGLKVQIFHGLAGEKKGHFKIRDYFDLYLTQGPYFSDKFMALAKKHKNFNVTETGWCKLDKLYSISQETKRKKKNLLKQYSVKHIILYAPTFSPSLTSAKKLKHIIKKLASNKDILCIIKFHDKMNENIIEDYRALNNSNTFVAKEDDITLYLQIADLMLSDTSSVVYEFILLDKPVITLDSKSENITWSNHKDTKNIYEDILDTLKGHDIHANARQETIAKYHPYSDGKSASRMIKSAKEHIRTYGVPTERKIPWHRKLKLKRLYN